jgi:hypothetical protein
LLCPAVQKDGDGGGSSSDAHTTLVMRKVACQVYAFIGHVPCTAVGKRICCPQMQKQL